MRYTLCPGVVLRVVYDEYLLLATRAAKGKVPSICAINVTGAYFWRLLEQGLDLEEIVSRTVRDYGIPAQQAQGAFLGFFSSLRDSGYVQEG